MPDPSVPPPTIHCDRVIAFAIVNKSVAYSGHTSLFRNGKEVGRVPCLAICDDRKHADILLLHCDRDWTVLGCGGGYGSVAEAKENAERIYPGLSTHWVDAGYSEEDAERHLDEIFQDDRCSFCGKRADQIEKLIGKDQLRICNLCIDEFHGIIHES